MSEDSGLYEVEKIVKRSKSGDRFLIKWKGYSHSDNTWEPLENLTGCSDLVDKFIKNETQKARQRRQSRRSDSKILHLATPSPVAELSSRSRRSDQNARQQSTPPKTTETRAITSQRKEEKSQLRNDSLHNFGDVSLNKSRVTTPRMKDMLVRPSIKINKISNQLGTEEKNNDSIADNKIHDSAVASRQDEQDSTDVHPEWLRLRGTDVVSAILLCILIVSVSALLQWNFS